MIQSFEYLYDLQMFLINGKYLSKWEIISFIHISSVYFYVGAIIVYYNFVDRKQNRFPVFFLIIL